MPINYFLKKEDGDYLLLETATDKIILEQGVEAFFIVTDTATGTDSIGLTAASNLVTDTATGSDSIAISVLLPPILDTGGVTEEIISAPLITIIDTGGSPDSSQTITGPIFLLIDTGLGADSISRPLGDTATGTDSISITVGVITIADTGTGTEVLVLDGPAIPSPATPQTGGTNSNHVLRLLYGNDKRNPVRVVDLAQSAGGHIFLKSGGFAPGAGELTELWSGESIRFDGQQKLAESRKNATLSVTYDLTSGSMAGLSSLQREINRFFAEAKLRNVLKQGERVWLEYRWADGLNGLPTPTFGQLSSYYEVYAAKSPKWPDNLHDQGVLASGEIEGVTVELTCSPSPEGIKQRHAIAAGTITLDSKGVLIASGTSSKLHWPAYTGSGLIGNFTITGWITLNATWASGLKYIFDYFIDGANRLSIAYNASSNRFTITKIVSGSTFTANSGTFTIANGDDVQMILVQDSTTLHLYVNGVSVTSVAATNTMTDGGLISLGGPGTGTPDGVDVILDGWRIMPDDITATQALGIYTAELPIKQNGKQVGPPPYWWTKDGDGMVDSYDDATHDNWGIIGGIGGDIEASTEIRIFQSASNVVDFWLGIKSLDETFVSTDYLWKDTSTSTTTIAAVNPNFYSLPDLDPAKIAGSYRYLARLAVNPVATVNPGWSHSATVAFNYLPVTVTNGSFNILDLGEILINPVRDEDVSSFRLWLQINGLGIAWALDFIHLMPDPSAKITVSGGGPLSGNVPLIIDDGEAYLYAVPITSASNLATYLGKPLTVMPNQYNYLFMMETKTGGDLDAAQTSTIEVYSTPHYLLPGGMVA